MQYSLYDYYKNSFLTLEEILKHYSEHFYLNNHGRNKIEKVLSKAVDCDKMKELFGRSIQNRDFPERVPDFNDFSIAIAKTFWFLTQSNDTIALATLAAAVAWNKQINSHFLIIDEEEFRNNILLVFKKLEIVEEMTDTKYKAMTDPYIYSKMTSNSDVAPSVQAVNAKMRLRTSIVKVINELRNAEDNINYLAGTSLSNQQRKNLYTKLILNQINIIGSDTRRIADKYSIDLLTLVEEELEKAGMLT